jgi:hypothetical protein
MISFAGEGSEIFAVIGGSKGNFRRGFLERGFSSEKEGILLEFVWTIDF